MTTGCFVFTAPAPANRFTATTLASTVNVPCTGSTSFRVAREK